MKRKTFIKYSMCALSGILTATAFSVSSLSFLCFVSLVPLFYTFLNSDKQFFNAKSVFVYNIFYYIPLTFWLFELYPLTAFGIDEIPSFFLLSLGILLIGFMESAFMFIAFLPMNTILKGSFFSKKPVKVVIFSLLYILGENLQEIAGSIAFPWGRLGVILFEFTPFIQSSSLFGTLLLSFIILLINGFLALAVYEFIKNKTRRIFSLSFYGGIALLIFSLNMGFGIIKMTAEKNTETNINIAVVQGNLSSADKWQASIEDTLKLYFNLSENIINSDTDIVVWPETVVPTVINIDILKEIKEFTSKYDVTLITGAFVVVRGSEDYLEYNAMSAIYANGDVSPSYYKQKLVPFGEYIPLPWLFGNLLSGLELNLTAGTESTLIPSLNGKIGGLICYESIFPRIVRRIVNSGAELIILLSNDSWFGTSPAIRQHFGQSVLRAVECGRYFVRAGNTGISAIITPTGETAVTTAPFIPGAFTGSVAFIQKQTLYSVLGDIILIPSYAAFLFGAYMFFTLKLKKKR